MDCQQISSATRWEDEVGYSRAVRVGDRVEGSGTTATDADGAIVGVGDPYAQAKQAIQNVERALEATGSSTTRCSSKSRPRPSLSEQGNRLHRPTRTRDAPPESPRTGDPDFHDR